MNKKKLIILISIIVALAVLACVGIFALSGNKGKKIADKLDLGEKYLEELEYEKALAAYKEILKIDPKNVEAYLGMAEVYIAMGEYEEAVEALENGLELTQNASLGKALEEVRQLTTQDEKPMDNVEEVQVSDSQTKEEESEDNYWDTRFEACVVDGIYHNGYSLYDLTEHEHNLLASLIQYAGEEKWDEIFAFLYGEQLFGILDNYVEMWELEGTKYGAIRIAFEDYKIYMEINPSVKYLVIIPLNEGVGYLFRGSETATFNSGTIEQRVYFVANCVNGIFEGEFAYKEQGYDLETREILFWVESKGSMVNGLVNGIVYECNQYLSDEPKYMMAEFEAGIPQIFKESNEDGYQVFYLWYSATEQWEPLLSGSGEHYSIMSGIGGLSKEELNAMRYVTPYQPITGREVDGGMSYYLW